MNRVQIWGRLVKVPELRESPDKIPLCRFVVADLSNKRRTFFKIVVRGELASDCYNNLLPEDSVFVEGQLQQYSLDRPHGKENRFEILSSVVYRIGHINEPPPDADEQIYEEEEE